MKKKCLILILFLFVASVGSSQNFDKAKLDSYFDAFEAGDRFMGSVAVSKNGELIYTRSLGYTDVGNKNKANKNTKYRIGSISKTFTAALVLKGVEEGKIDLNQSIDKFFPEFPNASNITVLQLLQHRSGIHNFTDDENYLSWNTMPKPEKEMVDIIIKGGSDFEPNSKSDYSNSNYVLLSYILEKTFKKPYFKILSENITQPLDLNNTYLPNNANKDGEESNSYSWRGKWVLEADTDVSIPMGAGGIVSTPVDLVTFSDALFGGKIVNDESLKQMETVKDNFGLGLFPIPFGKKRGWGHSGAIDGFSSVFTYFPDGDISYALTSNGTNVNNNDISIAVLSAVYGVPYEIPEFYNIELTSEDLDQYVGIYSSSDIPLKITITKEDGSLIAQATGQSSFPLEATGQDKFGFSPAGVVLEFTPEESTMVLKQGGGVFTFKKE